MDVTDDFCLASTMNSWLLGLMDLLPCISVRGSIPVSFQINAGVAFCDIFVLCSYSGATCVPHLLLHDVQMCQFFPRFLDVLWHVGFVAGTAFCDDFVISCPSFKNTNSRFHCSCMLREGCFRPCLPIAPGTRFRDRRCVSWACGAVQR